MLIEEKYHSDVINKVMDISAQSVVKTLLYFSIFQYPITAEEIYEYCNGSPLSKDEILKELATLEKEGYISHKGSFYHIKNDDMAALVEKRLLGNTEAEKLLKIAERFSKFISWFPFVRGICVSGSLSKGYADKKSDIDYFIITDPGRLWIARTALVFFKKVFLFNSHKYFCVNYFIDADNLEIPDKNLFAATELISIIPASNPELYEKLIVSNKWTKKFLPNGSLKTSKYKVLAENTHLLKRISEKIFSGRFGNKIDDMCFKLTLSTWKRKFKHFNADEFDLNLRTRKNVSKHHPNGFQVRVMKQFEESIRAFEESYNISLH